MGLFTNAKEIEAPKKPGRKSDTKSVVVAGLSRYAALDAAEKSIKSLKGIEEAEVKGFMTDHFIKEGILNKRKPDSFEGVEGPASGSMQLKIRSSASHLSEDDRIILDKHKVPYGENVIQEEAFLINPAYTNDMKLLALVEEALAGVNLPADFLMKQTKIVKHIATDASIDAVFGKSKLEAELLLPLVTTLAIRPKIEGDFWGIIEEITNPKTKAEIEAEVEAKA